MRSAPVVLITGAGVADTAQARLTYGTGLRLDLSEEVWEEGRLVHKLPLLRLEPRTSGYKWARKNAGGERQSRDPDGLHD